MATRLMKSLKRTPALNYIIRKPIQALWYGFWNTFFFFRNILLGPMCTLKIKNSKITVDLRDYILARYLYIFKIYEPEETRILSQILQKNMTVVDLGANIGYYTIMFSKIVGSKGHVLAVEASPYNYHALLNNITQNNCENVTALNNAVTDCSKEIKLLISNKNYGESRIRSTVSTYNSNKFTEEITVQGLTLDEIISRYSLKPDLIKIDIEGAEYSALQGMKNTLSKSDEVIIISEFNPSALRQYGSQPFNFIKELHEMQFKFFEILENGISEIAFDKLELIAKGIDAVNLLISRNSPI